MSLPLHLLLRLAGSEAPLLREVDLERTQPPVSTPPAEEDALKGVLASLTRSSTSLPHQRWGLVVPEGTEGDALLTALAPLVRLREEQQGAAARVYRVPPNQDEAAALSWCNSHYEAEDVPLRERPRYLLIAGTPRSVSLSLQQALGERAYVGRIGFDPPAGYATYAEKVCRWARHPHAHQGKLRLLTVRDGTAATREGLRNLIKPCHASSTSLTQLEVIPREEAGLAASNRQAFLDALSVNEAPSVLMTVSHGVGVSRVDAPSAAWQRERQGNMDWGAGQEVGATEVRSKPFLPGGIWLYFACFGAGTPVHSDYFPWLDTLSRSTWAGYDAQSVLSTLASAQEGPFLSALTQAALANTEGPLAIMAHLDLAWSMSFMDPEGAFPNRASRFFEPLLALDDGGRVGVAHFALQQHARNIAALLVLRAKASRAPPDAREAILWMMWRDLRNFVLLGDPACQLPVAASQTL